MICILDHFVDINKMVQIGSGTKREIDVKKLERRVKSEDKKIFKNSDKLILDEGKKGLI